MRPGIYDNIGIEEYHSNKEWISSTAIKKARRSLLDFWYYQNGYYDGEFKREFDFGNAFELALLDEEGFAKKVANEADIFVDILNEFPDVKTFRATKKYKDWADAMKLENKYIIAKDGTQSFDAIKMMLTSCYRDAVIQRLIKNVDYQKSIYWIDKETGLKLKTRPDICKLNKNVIIDVKTSKDASPESFGKDIVNYDYPIQATMQIDGVLQSGLMERVDFYYWLVVEKEKPFSAQIYEFSMEDRNWIYDEYRYVLSRIKKAYEMNLFPSYTDRADNKFGILRAKIPSYYSTYVVFD